MVDRLDLDTYHLQGAQGFLPDLAGDAAARQAVLDLIASYDANIQIDAGQLTVRGATLEDLSVDATVAGGTVVLRRAQFASLASTAASLEGRIGALDPVAGVDLRVSVDSGDPDGFLSALGIETPALLAPLAAAQATARLQGDAAVLVVDLAGTFPGGTLAVGGSVEQAFDVPAYDIAARVGHDDGQALVQLYAPSFAPRGPVGPVDLYTRIVGTDQAFDLADLQGTVGDMPIAGTVAIDRTGERPRVDADLRTGAIAVDRYLPPPRVAALSSGFVGRWGSLAVDVQPLAAVDGSLSLAATTLGIGDLVVADPALRATLEAGTLAVPALTGHVLGGNFGLQATLAVEDPAQVAFEIDLVGADLASGLRSLLDLDGLAGTFDFGIDATAHGSTIGAMIGSLSGEGLLAVRNGAILGVDLAQIDSGLTEASEPLDFLDRLREALREGETPFAAINVPFEVASGIALTEQLRAAGEIGFAEGRGMLDLAGERLDVSTEFYLYRHPEAPPFVIQLMGPLSNPVQRPQTQALQAYFAHKAAEALAERFATTPTPEPEPVEPRPNVAPPPPPGGPR